MDTVLAEAVTKIAALPRTAQRQIAEALLSREVQEALPVIEFDAPQLDPSAPTGNTDGA